ncbi:MAG: DUF4097 family beta strand repeat protein [Cyclobacteriaceae bacterium]
MKYLLISILLFQCLLATGQSKSKTYNEVLETKTLVMYLEKADLMIGKSPDSKIHVDITFKATNQDESLATQELTYMRYSLLRDGLGWEFRNGFFVGNANKIYSKLDVKINLLIPEDLSLTVENKYGNIDLEDVKLNASMSLTYGDIHASNLTGNLDVQLNYGELHGSKLQFDKLNGKLYQSKVWAEFEIDRVDINGNYSDLSLIVNRGGNIDITMKNSFINISLDDLKKFNYDLRTVGGEIFFPDIEGIELDDKKEKLKLGNDVDSEINISTTYNNIYVKEK